MIVIGLISMQKLESMLIQNILTQYRLNLKDGEPADLKRIRAGRTVANNRMQLSGSAS